MLTKTKKLITLALLTVCVFIPQKATAAETKESLTVSPSVIIVDENELGKSFEITISNNTGSKITLTPAEKLVTRDEQGKNIPSDANPAELLLEFNKETFDVEAGEEHKFQVRVKLSVQSNPGVYPAVSFKATGDRAGELGLASEILSVFLIQDFDGELSADTTVTVAAGAITVDRNFIVTGIVLNDGKKFFNPAGTIVISKDGKQVFEKQITSQIEGLLFPNEQKEFNITWLNELSGISALGNYVIEAKINPTPFSQTFVTRIEVFYIPAEILVLLIPLTAFILIAFVLISNLKKRKQLVQVPGQTQQITV